MVKFPCLPLSGCEKVKILCANKEKEKVGDETQQIAERKKHNTMSRYSNFAKEKKSEEDRVCLKQNIVAKRVLDNYNLKAEPLHRYPSVNRQSLPTIPERLRQCITDVQRKKACNLPFIHLHKKSLEDTKSMAFWRGNERPASDTKTAWRGKGDLHERTSPDS